MVQASFGTLQLTLQQETVPDSVAVGDFNGDTTLDLAIANIDSDNVSILLGNGKGTFGTSN